MKLQKLQIEQLAFQLVRVKNKRKPYPKKDTAFLGDKGLKNEEVLSLLYE